LSRLSDMLCEYDPQFQGPLARVREAASLVLRVLAAWEVVRRLAVRLMEESLTVRAQQRERWPICGRCRRWLQSKGFQSRTLHTLCGVIGWRRVGRCPKGCKGSRVAPLDQALGLVPHQRTGAEVQWMGCLLAVFVPYETARRLLRQLTGVELAASTLWGWVQQVGQRARVQLEGELEALAAGELPAVEPLAAELEALPLVIGADGVRVPFRPHSRTAKGKTRWREIKVAILARLGARLSRKANARDPALPAPVSGGVGYDRRLGPTIVGGSRAPRGAHGGAGGVAIGWRSGFVERVPAPLPGGRGGGDFRLLPCRAKPV
jgi:hypothetical protein